MDVSGRLSGRGGGVGGHASAAVDGSGCADGGATMDSGPRSRRRQTKICERVQFTFGLPDFFAKPFFGPVGGVCV